MDDDKTIRPGQNDENAIDKTIRADQVPNSNNIQDNEATIRPDEKNDEATVRPNSGVISSGMEEQQSTIRPDSGVISSGMENNGDKTERPAGNNQTDDIQSVNDPKLNDNNTNAEKSIDENFEIKSFKKNEEEEGFIQLEDGKYKRIQQIGSGGEAIILLIEKDKKQSVLKLYTNGAKPNLHIVEKISGFDHPGIIKIFGYGTYKDRVQGDMFYERLEYAKGDTLESIMPVKDMNQMKQLVFDLANALHYCHTHDITHCDIKPANILFRDKDKTQPFLADFGIASVVDNELNLHQTTKKRTKLFAPPEVEVGDDNDVIISREIDYYALGISILYMWMGVNPFKGLNPGMIKRIKQQGKITYPDEMPDELVTLIKGLTVISIENRWGFNQIERWYKGEKVEIQEDVIETSGLRPFKYDSKENLSACSLREMADLMEKDPDKGKAYLYKGRIEEWLANNELNDYREYINDIVETYFPTNQQAGLWAAIYALDPGRVYVAIDGTECCGDDQIAFAIEKNYERYAAILNANENDKLYMFLWSQGKDQRKLVNSLRNGFKTYSKKVAIYNVIYALDPSHPFNVEINGKDENNNTVIACNTPEEVGMAYTDKNINSKAFDLLTDGTLQIWLKHKEDNLMLSKIDKILNNKRPKDTRQIEIIYTLNPEIGLFRKPNDGSETYYHTREQLGQLICFYLCRAYQMDDSDYTAELKDHFQDDNGEINCFFRARGWTDIINYKRDCYNAALHKKQVSPYNNAHAGFKVAKALMGDGGPHYYFTESGKYYATNLLELDNVPKKMVKDAIEKGILKEWLSVFFHEDPYIQETDVFELKLIDYLNTIGKYSSGNSQYKRFSQAKSSFDRMISKNRKMDKFHQISRIALPVLMAIPLLIVLFFWFFDFQEMIKKFYGDNIYKPTLAYYGIVGWILSRWFNKRRWFKLSNYTKFISLGFIAIMALYYLGYMGIKLTVPYFEFIIAALILLPLPFFIKYCIKDSKVFMSKEDKNHLFSKANRFALYEPLFYAYNSKLNTFVSSKAKNVEYYKGERKKIMKNFWSKSLTGILTFTVFMFLFLNSGNPKSSEEKMQWLLNKTKQIDQNFKEISGDVWQGTFEGRRAELILNFEGRKDVNGSIKIFYDRPVEQILKGTFNKRSGKLILEDQKDISFKGKYNAIIDGSVIKGTYTLDKTGGKFPFQFSDKPTQVKNPNKKQEKVEGKVLSKQEEDYKRFQQKFDEAMKEVLEEDAKKDRELQVEPESESKVKEKKWFKRKKSDE